MPARTTRQAARQKVIDSFMTSLDRVIPPEESVPLKGRTFLDWENQAEQLKRAVIPTLLEERSALEENAAVHKGQAGHCPYCGSERVYLEKQVTHQETLSPEGPVVIEKSRRAGIAVATALFPPQQRDWALPAQVPLTPKAAERLARESASQSSFDNAARALRIDWCLQTLDGKQVERWGEALGQTVVQQRDAEVLGYHQGRRPACPANEPPLLVIGMDGGRWQSREKNPDTQSRWREDKVLTVSTYVPGDGGEGPEARKPKPLVTTYVATARDAVAFGPMARVEAERRGLRQAQVVIGMGDGGNWIDPLLEREFHVHARIIDWCHACEHLWNCARAAHGADTPQSAMLGERLEALLWDGRTQKVIALLSEESKRLGEPLKDDPPQHPRRVLSQNVGYFTKHQEHMNYPEFRRRGWPIGSGVTEAAVKQCNKRVKGTEQFWNERGVESILGVTGGVDQSG